ncbi:hypothetical protein BaRGS_00021034 [Batillaria attramentaria]|uniref:Uncharacterized protein n=1 Tax=Batillaria attramentaria TaxID=370345 RepID=A0ABD0KLA6_9CAEN
MGRKCSSTSMQCDDGERAEVQDAYFMDEYGHLLRRLDVRDLQILFQTCSENPSHCDFSNICRKDLSRNSGFRVEYKCVHGVHVSCSRTPPPEPIVTPTENDDSSTLSTASVLVIGMFAGTAATSAVVAGIYFWKKRGNRYAHPPPRQQWEVHCYRGLNLAPPQRVASSGSESSSRAYESVDDPLGLIGSDGYTCAMVTPPRRPLAHKIGCLQPLAPPNHTTTNQSISRLASPLETPTTLPRDYLHPAAPPRDTRANLPTTKEVTSKTPPKKPKDYLHQTASPNNTNEGHVSPCKTPSEDYLHPVAPPRDTKASLPTTKEVTPKTPPKKPKDYLHPTASPNYTNEGHVSLCKTPGEDYLHPVAPLRDTKANLPSTKEVTPKTPPKKRKDYLHTTASPSYTTTGHISPSKTPVRTICTQTRLPHIRKPACRRQKRPGLKHRPKSRKTTCTQLLLPTTQVKATSLFVKLP